MQQRKMLFEVKSYQNNITSKVYFLSIVKLFCGQDQLQIYQFKFKINSSSSSGIDYDF